MKSKKLDDNKLKWYLMPVYSLEQIMQVLNFGAKKYGDNNWQQLNNFNDRYYSACLRHIFAWKNGEKIDKESNCHHLSMVVWQCFTLMMYEKYNIGIDDRNPYHLDMMKKEKQRKLIEKWKLL